MKSSLHMLIALLLALTVTACGSKNEASVTEKSVNPVVAQSESAMPWREQYAYSMGFAAYQYLFPYLYMAKIRYAWTNMPRNTDVVPYAPVNHFWHATKLTDASWREGGGPNNDTLYSVAWVHVDAEPIILSIPASDRYYTFPLVGFDSDNFAYVGTRTTGNDGGHFALLPKGWKGELPEGVTALTEVATPWVLVGGRTVALNREDLSAVHALQKQYRLTPLSYWGKDSSTLPASRDVFKPFDSASDPLADWKTINKALTENPPLEREKQLMALFASIKIGPGMNVDELDEDSKRGLIRGAQDALKVIQAAQIEGAADNLLGNNGWIYSLVQGRGADNGDYFFRTVHQSYSGIHTHDPEEALFYAAFVGDDKQPLHGSKQYKIHFAPGQEPDVKAFWSLTLYEEGANFTDNEIDRYSLGDRTKGLQRNADGSLTIYIQHQRPSDDKVSNWLPAPDNDEFFMWLRTYMPQEKHLTDQWQLPPVEVVAE